MSVMHVMDAIGAEHLNTDGLVGPFVTTSNYYFPIAVFIEGAIYGFYTPIFFIAITLWMKRENVTFSSRVYYSILVMMWLVATAHIVVSIERFLRIFVIDYSGNGLDTYTLLLDGTKWDNLAHLVLSVAMMWTGNALAMYRTYVAWNESIRVVILPIILDIANMVVSVVTIHWFRNPNLVEARIIHSWYLPIFPLMLSQNILTTGLLFYKVWERHLELVAGGVHWSASGRVAWMIIETGLLYVLELLVTIILIAIEHPAAQMVVMCLVPSIGTIFVFMITRTHYQGKSKENDQARLTRYIEQALPDLQS